RRHGAHDDVPRHRLHRGAGPVRVRARLPPQVKARVTLVGGAVASVVLLSSEGTAFAKEKPTEVSKCVENAVKTGQQADTCLKAPGPHAPGRGGGGRRPTAGRGRHPGLHRPRPRRPAGARGHTVDRAGREGRRAQPRPRHPDAADRELHQRGGGAASVSDGGAQTRVEAYADALFAVARAEGTVGDVEDELFRFARTLEGSDELRSTLTDQALPAE